MSLVLTRNAALRERWKELKRIDPESGTQWEKFYLPKTDRDTKLYGWYHNQPYHNWNNKAHYAFEKFTMRDTVLSHIFKERSLSRFAHLLRICEDSVIHDLSTRGPWTVFAPLNSAFDNMAGGWGAFKTAAMEEPLKLHSFLRQHASQGNNKLKGFPNNKVRFNSLEGVTYDINVSGSFDVNNREIKLKLKGSSLPDARVQTYDARASNGYLHVVDSVLAYGTISAHKPGSD